jgi:large subunit ribosomal protein L45
MQKDPPLYDVELVQARIIAADPKDDSTGFVQLTVKIPSKQSFVARDKKGKIVSGDTAKVLDVVDHWVFEIPLSTKVQQKWRVAGRLTITE